MIRAANLIETPWANAAGRKADIATGDGWLLGFAWLDRDAPFSDYSGYDRTIMLLEGPGFSLDFPSGESVQVTDRFAPVAFDGAGLIACRTLGSCRVLNAISAYPKFSHTMLVLTGNDLASVAPGTRSFAVVLRGSLGDAGLFDTMMLDGAADGSLTPSADLLVALVRFERNDLP